MPSSRICQICDESFEKIPLLRCGHFLCSECYVKIKNDRPVKKSNKCPCPFCSKNMVRRLTI